MAEFLNGLQRTKYCGEFSDNELNKSVVALGWVAKRRDFGNLIFIDLRDKAGIIQVVVNSENYANDFTKIAKIRNEYVLAVMGTLVNRDENTINAKLATGYFEIKAEDIKVLSESEHTPFAIEDDYKVNEVIRLKHRYLDLRKNSLQENLRLRYEISKAARQYLDSQRFIEIETPFLGKSTPEGARDYLVPSRTFPGKFFALPQSPQLYKQLLMIAGFDRYFQIARCFRDEDLRADRQPEFTQIDIEASFVDKEEQIMTLVEGLMRHIFATTQNLEFPQNVLRLPYHEAMARYGSDKPDTRFGLEIIDVASVVYKSSLQAFKDSVDSDGFVGVINAKGYADKFARRELDGMVETVKANGGKLFNWLIMTSEGVKSSLTKFFEQEVLDELLQVTNTEVGDILFFIAGTDKEKTQNALGKLRLSLADKFELVNPNDYKVLWVTDFPLFEYDEEDKRYVAKHHPFTSPKDEDLHMLETEPGKVRAKAYDLVINGYEVGGGSIRIYNNEVQKRMFRALGFTEESIQKQFGFFVDAFKYGTPPHGGIAFGLDRLTMLLAKTSDIRSVIAFPKIQTAMDLMTQAPSEVSLKQLKELKIATTEEKEDKKDK